MRPLVAGVGGALVAALVVIGAISMRVPPAEAAAPAADGAAATPILVELFTSEGCSSCPPADVVLARLEAGQPVAGARVIALAHHVDYWDRLGWRDPWSSTEATARQRSYASLKSGSYTPQVVVDGRAEMVGSRAGAIEQAIAAAAKEPHLSVDLTATPAPDEEGAFDVTVKGALPAGASWLVALVQARGRVAVPRGENAGQTLEHTAIVRSFVALGGPPPDRASAGAGAKARVKVPPALEAPRGTAFSIVAFAQEDASRRVLGAAERPLTLAR